MAGNASFLSCHPRIALILMFAWLWPQHRAHARFDPPADTGTIKSIIKEAVYLSKASLPDSASRLFEESLLLSKEAGYGKGICYAYIGLSSCRISGADYTAAMQNLRQAEEVNSDLGIVEFAALIENRKGQIYDLVGDYEKAAQHYLKEIKIREGGGTTGNGYMYSNMGQLLLKAKDYQQAKQYLDLALQKALQAKDSSVLAPVLINKSNLVYRQAGDSLSSEATALMENAIAIAARTGQAEAEATALSNLAAFLMSEKPPHYEQALFYLRRAQGIVPAGSLMFGTILLNIGACYSGLGEFTQAEQFMKDAEALATSFQAKSQLADVYEGLSRIYLKAGQYKKAATYLGLLNSLRDSMDLTAASTRIGRLQFEYEVANKDNELMRKELMISQQSTLLRQRNIQAIGLLAGVLGLTALFWLYYRNRRRMMRQKIEIAAWQATLQGEERERERLARQLHDQVGGSLSTVRMWFATLQQRYKQLLTDQDYKEALGLLDQTLGEVRSTAHHLMPELLLRHGLADAVRVYCQHVERATSLMVEYHYFGFIGGLGEHLELMIYRSIQELLQNVVRHANATRVIVQLSRHDSILDITVEDNGQGATPDHSASTGMGLRGIQEAVKKMHGNFSFQQQAGKGAGVYIELPITELIQEDEFFPEVEYRL